jgi:phage protein D
MRPAFKIESGGTDFTNLYEQRDITIEITETSTEHSDSCSVSLSNKDGKIEVPEDGKTLTISLGYVENLTVMGEFIVDSATMEGPPDGIRFTGKAAPFTSATGGFKPFQTRRTRSFDDITLGDLVATIAGECGLTPAISPALSSTKLAHVDQTNESGMNLLTRLARDFQAVMKPKQGHLVFAKRGEATSVSGKALGGLTIDKSEVSRYSGNFSNRTKFSKVKTRFHDTEKGRTMLATTDEGGTTVAEEDPDGDPDTGEDNADYEHPHDYPDEETATAAGKSMLDATQRGANTVSVTIAGRADIVAEGNVTLTGFPSRMNGAWCIKTVKHNFGKGGFTTTIEGEEPGGAAGKAKKEAKAKEVESGIVLKQG